VVSEHIRGVQVRDVVIRADDGARLAGTLYQPAGDGPFAALLEALPYRKDDVTESYRATYVRFATAGFAVLRLDLRGTGSSTGVATDEYPDVERTDLRSAIRWLAAQPWSTGRVGMFGTSYSGFNSLQMAAAVGELDVPELGAVVATYATDDRYTDDVHYAGGVLRALDLIDYPLYMIAMNALPPVPAVFGDGWRDEWHRRVETTPPWLIDWLRNPLDGPAWRRGSIRLGPDGAGYERMGCPTMIIAGWADGYRNNTFRVVEQYERNGLPWRLLAGPWVHKSPERARPGPNIDDDVEIIAFFDEYLRGGPARDDARGQVYVRRPIRPEPDLAFHPGRWADVDAWPPDGLGWVELRPDREGVDSLAVQGDVGVAAWNSCGGGLPWGQPLDQRDDNARSITYDWPIEAETEMVGNGRVALRVRTDQAYGHVSAKLCDVFPDGTSALITRTMIDLTHVGCWPADPDGEVGRPATPLRPGEWIDVALELEATTWTLEPGHVLRLAIAGTDWPNCWPPPGPVTLDVDASSACLSLPIVDRLPDSAAAFVPGAGPGDDEADGVTWRIERDVLGRETRVVTRYGGTYEGLHGAMVTDDYRGELGVSTSDPSVAWARGTSSFEIVWPEGTVRAESTLAVRSDAQRIEVEILLTVHDGDEILATRTWVSELPR
jgi:predicted acyl esterase